MSWVVVGVGGTAIVAGAATQMDANQRASTAAGRAAEASMGFSGDQITRIQNAVDEARQRSYQFSQASPEELSALGRSLQSSEAALNREERLLSAIDPALMEASSQALRLLRGETADVNKPMNDLRASQRQKLVSSLRSQYGPGAESTSIGQRALQSFDMETNSMFAQNQQSALGQVFGIASSDLGQRQSRGISGLQQVGQGYSAIQERQLGATMNLGAMTVGALSGTSQMGYQAAGAPYVGQALQAQGQAQMGQSMMNMGGNLGMAYLTRGNGNSNTNTGTPPQGTPKT